MRKLFLLISVWCMICYCDGSSNGAKDPSELLPGERDISGWMQSGDARIANDPQSLYNEINGGADKYIEFGFVSGAFQNYESGSFNFDIAVEIYNMDLKENAIKIYDNLYESGFTEVSPPVGDRAREKQSFLGVFTVEFIKNEFFCRINAINIDNDELVQAKQTTFTFAQTIVSKIK